MAGLIYPGSGLNVGGARLALWIVRTRRLVVDVCTCWSGSSIPSGNAAVAQVLLLPECVLPEKYAKINVLLYKNS